MSELRVDCPAKINLFLEVLGKRADGYHEVVTVMQAVELYDRLFFRDKESGITIRCDNSSVPTDQKNLIFRSAEVLMRESGIKRGLEVEIEKRIPVASGLGGASSNAAATLIALNQLWSLGLTKQNLLTLSEEIGTDIAFFIHIARNDAQSFDGGTFLGRGRGNEMTPLKPMPPTQLILVAPRLAVSTKWVYENLHLRLTAGKRDFKMCLEALEKGDLALVSELMFNRLEEVVLPKFPEVAEIKDELLRAGAIGSLMTGSGPVVFGFAPEEEKAQEIAERVSTRRKEDRIYVTKTLSGDLSTVKTSTM